MWRVQHLSNKNRETFCGRAFWPTFRASTLVDNDTYTLDWNSCTRKSIAEAQGTRRKASTTRSRDKDLYVCIKVRSSTCHHVSDRSLSLRVWSTKSTTTTSRRPLKRRRKYFAFGSRSKAKAKPRRPSTTCSSSRTIPFLERTWIDIEPRAQFDQAYPVAKRINTLLRHGELPREEDGAIVFWRLQDDLRNNLEHSQYWSDDVRKSKMAGGGGNNKRFQCCTDPSGQEILYLRALQGHSGRNPIDPSLQDSVLIPNNFFEYFYHIGCAESVYILSKIQDW